MAALSDLRDLRRDRGSVGLRPFKWPERGRHSAEFLEITARGVRATSAERLSPGDGIRIWLPGIGSLVASVTWVRGAEFGADFCGPSELRLLFLPSLRTRHRSLFQRLGR
jgi:hypothetical protein